MNNLEIAQILRFVHALCPAQKIDEFTPDAWELVLEDIRFDDAKAALKTLGQQLRFIAPADIAGEVRRAANTRPSFPPGTAVPALEAAIPDCDPDNVGAYLRALRDRRHQAATGQLAQRFNPNTLEGTPFHRNYAHIPSKWDRTATVRPPVLAIDAPAPPRPDDIELAVAEAVLAGLPDRPRWEQAARRALEADGRPLTKRAVAIHAADLATTGAS